MANLPKHSSGTESGEHWLTMALDPFHDYDVPVTGLPDRTNIPTAVQFIKRKITIVAPPNLTGTQTWDCHVFSLPVLSTYDAVASDGDRVYEDLAYHSGSAILQMGNINVARMQSGNPTYVQDSFATWDDTSTAITAYSPTDGNKASQLRLIGGGFEVHNDTADLYKNGSVTCYSSSNDWSDTSIAMIGDGGGGGNLLCSAQRARYPPVLATDAALYTDARTWSAKDGCYVPLRLDLDSGATKFKPRCTGLPVFQDRENGTEDSKTGKMVPLYKLVDVYNVTDSVAGIGYQTIAVLNGNGTAESKTNGWLQAPIETTGAFFSGLSQETVLTLDIRWMTEIAPTSANPAMLSMCSPSSHYDPRALECYTNCLLKLPPGVPVTMNEKGDFWRMAVKSARSAMSFATPLLASFGPTAAAGVTLADAGLALADNVLSKKKAKAKAVPKPQGKATRTATGNNTLRK